MPIARLTATSDGAELILLADGQESRESFEFTTQPRSWARAQLREWGYSHGIHWHNQADGVWVTGPLR